MPVDGRIIKLIGPIKNAWGAYDNKIKRANQNAGRQKIVKLIGWIGILNSIGYIEGFMSYL